MLAAAIALTPALETPTRLFGGPRRCCFRPVLMEGEPGWATVKSRMARALATLRAETEAGA
jgi:hypothetical protein